MEKKQCSECKEWKSLDCFGKYKRSKDGLYPHCKKCVSKYNKEYRNNVLEREEKRRIKLKNLEMNKKQCTKCKEWKTLDCFGKDKRSKDGLTYQCKECTSKYGKEYRKNNIDKELKKSRKYYENNKDKCNKKSKKYYENNKLKTLKYKKEYINSPMKFNSKSKARQEIEIYEKEIRESADGYLECKCTYCGGWFKPSNLSIQNRISAMNTENQGEQRLYCSEPCKKACPTYGKILYSAEQAISTSREVQPELRQMVLLRDNYTCQRCDKHKDELEELGISLHCHHLEGIHWEPLMSADIDMCVTYCQPCHVKAHQEPDCGNNDMQCIDI